MQDESVHSSSEVQHKGYGCCINLEKQLVAMVVVERKNIYPVINKELVAVVIVELTQLTYWVCTLLYYS